MFFRGGFAPVRPRTPPRSATLHAPAFAGRAKIYDDFCILVPLKHIYWYLGNINEKLIFVSGRQERNIYICIRGTRMQNFFSKILPPPRLRDREAWGEFAERMGAKPPKQKQQRPLNKKPKFCPYCIGGGLGVYYL